METTLQDGATIEETLVLTFFDLANQLSKLGEEVAAGAALTTQQWLVLLQVAGDPNFPLPGHVPQRSPGAGVMGSEIALARGVSRASISVLVTQLLKRGLVRQEEEAGDRRFKRLFLTDEGGRIIDALEDARQRANRELFTDLDPTEQRVLLGALRKCLGRLWIAGNGATPTAFRHLLE